VKQTLMVLARSLAAIATAFAAVARLQGGLASIAAEPPHSRGADEVGGGLAPSRGASDSAPEPGEARARGLLRRPWIAGWLARRSRRFVAVALVVALGLAVAGGVIAFFVAGATSGSYGAAQAGSVNVPTSVTVPAYSTTGTVHVSWTGSTLANGGAVAGYWIQRYAGSTPSNSCGTSLASPIGTLSCNDTGVAAGQYTYTVSAVYHNWFRESAPTSVVVVDQTAPTSTISFPAAAPYNTAGWNGGCATKICGTAQDEAGGSGLQKVEVSVQRGSGNFWNGSAFSTSTQVWNLASGTSNWSYAFPAGNFPADGGYTVSVRATDNAGTVQSPATTRTFTYDTTAPTATIDLQAGSDSGTSNSDNITNAASLVFNVTFSESVSGLSAGNFTNTGTATGCSFGSLTGSGASYTITASGCSAGTIVVRLAANAVSDTAGNQNALTNGSTVTIDRTAPTPTAVNAVDDNSLGQLTASNGSHHDLLTFTYSENIASSSITTGNVSVTFTNNDATCTGSADSISVPGVGKVCLGSQGWVTSTSTKTESLSVATNVVTLTITNDPDNNPTGVAASNFTWSTSGGTAADNAGNTATGSVTTNAQRF
jgi:hypothetical protein